MPCVPLPNVPVVELPFDVTKPKVKIPGIPGAPDFCCKFPTVATPDLPVKLPPIPPAVFTALRGARQAILKALDSQPLKCPRE